MATQMRHGSLFSGYEGLGLAIAAVFPNAETKFVADIDPGACKILAHRLPDVPNLGDVSKIDWTPWRGLIEILSAGFPCQDVSAAGKQAGLKKGTRTGLFHEVARAIDELRPPLVFLENVRGLLSARGDEPTAELEHAWAHRDLCDRLLTHLDSRHARAVREGREADVRHIATRRVRVMGLRKRAVDAARRAERLIVRAIGTVLGSLADLGYDAAWVCIPASGVGAAHRRLRVFILAWPADAEGIPGFVVDGDGRLVADSDGAGRGERRGPVAVRPEHDAAEHTGQDPLRMLPTPRATDGTKGGPNQRGSSGDLMLPSAVMLLKTPTAQLAVNGGSQHPDKRKAGGHGATLADEVEHLLPTPAAHEPGGTAERYHERLREHDGRESSFLPLGMAVHLLPTPVTDPASRNGHARNLGSEARRWGDYAPAIRRWERAHVGPAPAATQSSAKGNPQLSPRFTEWLMGLASGWITDVPDITRNEALKACGNGVVPQQGAAGLRWLLRVMVRALAA